MNIDIVNRQISNKLGISERKVTLVNKFYWRNVYDYFYSYDHRPLNIDNVCVFHNDKWLIKKAIRYYIKKIRTTAVSPKFKEGSLVRAGYISEYKNILRNLWKLRKENKYTN